MRIGDSENFLTITSTPIGSGYSALKFEAKASGAHFNFAVSHDRVVIEFSDAVITRFAEFESLKADQFQIKLSEDGWLQFSRNLNGYLSVRYRLVSRRELGAVEGELNIEGEFANEFCREFKNLLKGQNHSTCRL